jgi:NlpC/P60 family
MANHKGLALAAAGIGIVYCMSGLNGWGITNTLKELLQGSGKFGPNINPITGGTSTAGGYGATGNAIVSDAERYIGDFYVWGGSSPAAGFDCSGLVNYVIGRDLHMAIPGCPSGSYSGHGPVTGQWLIWNGAITIPANQAEAGDLACWPTHIGIVAGPSSMISALDQAYGVAETPISGYGPVAEPLVYRRLIAVSNNAIQQSRAVQGGRIVTQGQFANI